VKDSLENTMEQVETLLKVVSFKTLLTFIRDLRGVYVIFLCVSFVCVMVSFLYELISPFILTVTIIPGFSS
jgi:hypothetical protein